MTVHQLTSYFSAYITSPDLTGYNGPTLICLVKYHHHAPRFGFPLQKASWNKTEVIGPLVLGPSPPTNEEHVDCCFKHFRANCIKYLRTVSSVSVVCRLVGWVATQGCSEAVTAAACSVVPMCPPLPTTLHTLPSSTPAAAHAPRLAAAASQRDPRPAALPHHPTTARRHLEGQQADLAFQRGGSRVDVHLPLDPPQPDPLAE